MMPNKLTTKWRKTYDDPSVDDSRPMDTQEQEELVRSFEKNHAEQSRFWRRVFAAFLCVQAIFLVYSICRQVLAPWELPYHAYFMDEVDSWTIISADWVGVLACSMGIVGLLHKSENRRRWLWHSCYVGIIPAVFWLYFMLRMPRFRWELLWLPFGPLGGTGISLYVDHILLESLEEIKKLRSYMYAYKAS